MNNQKIDEKEKNTDCDTAPKVTAEQTEPENKESADTAEEQEKVSKKEQKLVSKLEKQLAELQAQQEETKDKYLRVVAEYENYRKRSTKEKSDAYSDAYADALKAFLPLSDSLMQATAFDPEDQGIKALCKQFSDILTKLGVSEIESDGKPFDPNLHNAIMHEEDDSVEENTVVQTFQKGYKLGEKVIRPAMVKVAN